MMYVGNMHPDNMVITNVQHQWAERFVAHWTLHDEYRDSRYDTRIYDLDDEGKRTYPAWPTYDEAVAFAVARCSLHVDSTTTRPVSFRIEKVYEGQPLVPLA